MSTHRRSSFAGAQGSGLVGYAVYAMLGLEHPMSDRVFPPNHESRLVTTFKYVDDVLTQAVERLESSSSSPFSEYVADVGPAERKIVAEYLDRVRASMRGFLDRHQIAIPPASTSALWATSTACVYAGVSIEELRGRYMRAYGAVSPEADAELERMVAELTDALNKMNAYLAEIKGEAPTPNPRSIPRDKEG
jgi:hypothetical protein